MTPNPKSLLLLEAGWQRVSDDVWKHPSHGNKNHSWVVALLLSDLPRIKWDSGTFETLIPVGIGYEHANSQPGRGKKVEKVA